jgi:hypothetical protein
MQMRIRFTLKKSFKRIQYVHSCNFKLIVCKSIQQYVVDNRRVIRNKMIVIWKIVCNTFIWFAAYWHAHKYFVHFNVFTFLLWNTLSQYNKRAIIVNSPISHHSPLSNGSERLEDEIVGKIQTFICDWCVGSIIFYKLFLFNCH